MKWRESTNLDDEVYDFKWLLDFLEEKLWAPYSRKSNVLSIVPLVMEQCFSLFWDTWADRYRMSMFYSANMGHLS